MTNENRDFNKISPSAEFLIRLKAYTTVPFAKEAAALLVRGPAAETVINPETYKQFFFRLMIHFETRYRTIDNILSLLEAGTLFRPDHQNGVTLSGQEAGTLFRLNQRNGPDSYLVPLSCKNFLEISSGYSFRSLYMCYEKNINFIDTDLPGLIKEKKKVVAELIKNTNKELIGKLELEPLNTLNEEDFMRIISKFPEGPVTIINEGLLPYLNHEEKSKLCSIIHDVLEVRGGYWITGDVYSKEKSEWNKDNMPEEAKQWRDTHRTEENKFDDFNQAEEFFQQAGFDILYRESRAIDQLSCLMLLGDKKEDVIEKLKTATPDRQTWCLQVKVKDK